MALLSDWALRYGRAAAADLDRDLLAIGREMFIRLDSDEWASSGEGELNDFELEIRAGPRSDLAGATRAKCRIPGR